MQQNASFTVNATLLRIRDSPWNASKSAQNPITSTAVPFPRKMDNYLTEKYAALMSTKRTCHWNETINRQKLRYDRTNHSTIPSNQRQKNSDSDTTDALKIPKQKISKGLAQLRLWIVQKTNHRQNNQHFGQNKWVGPGIQNIALTNDLPKWEPDNLCKIRSKLENLFLYDGSMTQQNDTHKKEPPDIVKPQLFQAVFLNFDF